MTEYRGIHVVFATPCFSQSVSLEYVRSIIETDYLLWQNGITTAMLQRPGDCFVARARNRLVNDFLTQFPDCENFFFLDDDIGWPAQKVLEFLQRPDDIVAGVYPKKSAETDFPVGFAYHQDGTLNEPGNGLVEAWTIPTGFMRIKRHVLEKMAAEYGTYKDMDIDEAGGTSINDYPNIFVCGPNPEMDNLFTGEDTMFCFRWQKMGGSMWVDPDIEFMHRGSKRWKANMQDHMQIIRAKAAAMKKEAAE